MSNSKPLKNGHAPARTKVLSQSQSAIRQRRCRERRRRGAVSICSVVEPDLIEALVQYGWLLEEQKRDPRAVHDALSALTYQALSAALRPVRSGQAFLPIGLDIVQDAAPWLPSGVQLTAESAGKAVGTAVKCGALMGIGPAEYASHVRRMLEERAH